MTLGVDVVPASGSTLAPRITGLSAKSGLRVATDGIPKGPQARAPMTADSPHAVLATITAPRRKANFTATYTTKITATGQTKGDYLLGYYLPGDANGDGKVTQVDLVAIKAGIGQTVNDDEYNFDADADRDGAITRADWTLARGNLGVRTTIVPDFTANLDPATDTGAADRITNTPTVKFTGDAAPGAKIAYTEVNQKAPEVTTTANPAGKYSVDIPLSEGTSTFKVSSVDAFGQTISGSIQPVTYTTSTVPQKTTTS